MRRWLTLVFAALLPAMVLANDAKLAPELKQAASDHVVSVIVQYNTVPGNVHKDRIRMRGGAVGRDLALVKSITAQVPASALAALHAAPDPERNFAFLQYPQAGDTVLRRHVAHAQAWYDYAVSLGGRCPLIERGLRWLAENWPADSGETVLSWGDARVNNVIYRDFRPVALLDWEMAGLGPREIDIAWLVGGHRVFQDIAGLFGSPGMPHFGVPPSGKVQSCGQLAALSPGSQLPSPQLPPHTPTTRA